MYVKRVGFIATNPISNTPSPSCLPPNPARFLPAQMKAREWELGLATEAQIRADSKTNDPPFFSYRLFRR